MTQPLRRTLAALLIALVAILPTPGSGLLRAQTGENLRYAAVVVDAVTGEVMFARHADSRRYPASITKVMTLYLVFEALAEGRIKLDDRITVSPRAASQPPSKLGLAAGQTITVEDAMRATAVRSANDMAVALAEFVGGSEARFAGQMTLKAEELGMTQTRYVNANGLPDARQLTSARDLAILCRAIMRDFPQYYRYFGLHDWNYDGRSYRNTNGLLGSNGYDGIKTGYTNASGYNLAASAVRNGRRLVVVVLGGRSSASRNAHLAELMDTGFEVVRRREAGETIEVAQLFFEQRGYGIGPDNSAPVAYASLTSDEAAGQGSSERPADVTAILNASAAPQPVTPPPAPRAQPPSQPQPPRREPAGQWTVQVGAFRDERVANDWLGEIGRRFRSQFRGAERSVQNTGGWYRSRFSGMTEDAARAACAALAERRLDCRVIQP